MHFNSVFSFLANLLVSELHLLKQKIDSKSIFVLWKSDQDQEKRNATQGIFCFVFYILEL